MSIDDTPTGSPARRWATRIAIGVAGTALVVGAGLWLSTLSGGKPAPKRQVARLALLPDTPPPPPPPPPERPPEPQRQEAKAAPVDEAPKQAEAPKPANEPIKMEGAAGDGPSAFAAGAVRNEYAGGTPGTGPREAAAAAAVDRGQQRLYANGARELLREAIERHLRSEADQAVAAFQLWLEADGRIRRVELTPTGDAQLDQQLRAALDDTMRELRLPPPPASLGSSTALRFRLTVRPQG